MIAAVVAPEWAMQTVLGVFLTHRLSGDAVIVLVEDSSVRPIVREQWEALGSGEALRRVARLGEAAAAGGQGGSTAADVLLALDSPRATVTDLARRDEAVLWAERTGVRVVRGTLPPDAFAPGWDMAALAWRRQLFAEVDQPTGQTSGAAAEA